MSPVTFAGTCFKTQRVITCLTVSERFSRSGAECPRCVRHGTGGSEVSPRTRQTNSSWRIAVRCVVLGFFFVHTHLIFSAWVSSVRNQGGRCEVSRVTSDSLSQSCVLVAHPLFACTDAILVVSLSSQVKLCQVLCFTVADLVYKWLRGAFGIFFPCSQRGHGWASDVEVASGDEAAFSVNN